MSETTLFQDHADSIEWPRCIQLSSDRIADAKDMLGYFVAELPTEQAEIQAS